MPRVIIGCIRMSVLAAPIAAAWLAVAPPGEAASPACGPDAEAALTAAAAAVDRGDFAGGIEALESRPEGGAACPLLTLATASLRGWLAAIAAGDRGGAADVLRPAQAALDALAPAAAGPPSADAYAAALLHGAVVAAQDEREELQVWIEHARDLSGRLGAGRQAPRWPLPVDVAEGELWFLVDDFELSEAAFSRALASSPETPLAWRGLARARDRRGDRQGACAAYRRTLEVAQPGSGIAAEARGYVLVCTP